MHASLSTSLRCSRQAAARGAPRAVCLPGLHCSARTVAAALRADGDESGVPFAAQLRSVAQNLAAAAVAASLLLTPVTAASAETQVLRFPVSDDPEIFAVQKTMVEAWTIVTQAYVDETFNHTQWDAELATALTAAGQADSAAEAVAQLPALLARLGDPFTRWLPPKTYEEFRIGNDGSLQGVGMLVASDPSSGRLVVLAPIQGSPADEAGIMPGDELLGVDGTSTDGLDTDRVVQRLRGKEGSSVLVKVARHPQQQIPGVAGAPAPAPGAPPAPVEYRQFRLRRAQVALNPVFATPVHIADHVYGYVRLVTFSQNAAEDMQHAIAQLQRDGAEAFILDLRNNPGGRVDAAMDVAALWLDGPAPIFNVQDRDSGSAELHSVALEGGHAPPAAPADQPLVVLVNKGSASASEILAGALRDNHRALVLGDSPTFGKGKIQSVFELADGSALFVTVAKYRTPAGSEIDQIGVKPDRSCSTPPQQQLQLQHSAAQAAASAPAPAAVGAVGRGAAASMTGIPVGPGASERVLNELETDSCVLTAEALLQRKVEAQLQEQQQQQKQQQHFVTATLRRAPSLVATRM